MHLRVSNGRGDFWAAPGAPVGGQASHPDEPRPLFSESRVRGVGQRRDAGPLFVARALRKTRPAGTRPRVCSGAHASLAEAFLSVFRIAGSSVRRPGAGHPQKPQRTRAGSPRTRERDRIEGAIMSSVATNADSYPSTGRWERAVPVYGFPLVNGFFLGLSALVLVAFVLTGYRELAGLGPVSGMNDAYGWGIWKTFNVMVL